MARTDFSSRLLAALGDVRPGEGGLVAVFMGFTFFEGLSAELVQIAAYSLFLDTYDATMLPWVYMGLAGAPPAPTGVGTPPLDTAEKQKGCVVGELYQRARWVIDRLHLKSSYLEENYP
jgi:hypothetical protein